MFKRVMALLIATFIFSVAHAGLLNPFVEPEIDKSVKQQREREYRSQVASLNSELNEINRKMAQSLERDFPSQSGFGYLLKYNLRLQSQRDSAQYLHGLSSKECRNNVRNDLPVKLKLIEDATQFEGSIDDGGETFISSVPSFLTEWAREGQGLIEELNKSPLPKRQYFYASLGINSDKQFSRRLSNWKKQFQQILETMANVESSTQKVLWPDFFIQILIESLIANGYYKTLCDNSYFQVTYRILYSDEASDPQIDWLPESLKNEIRHRVRAFKNAMQLFKNAERNNVSLHPTMTKVNYMYRSMGLSTEIGICLVEALAIESFNPNFEGTRDLITEQLAAYTVEFGLTRRYNCHSFEGAGLSYLTRRMFMMNKYISVR